MTEAIKGRRIYTTLTDVTHPKGWFLPRPHYWPQAQRDKKPGSYAREASLFRHWIDKAIGHRPLIKIGAVDLERLKKNMTTPGLSPRVKTDKPKGQGDTDKKEVPACSPRTIEYALAVVRQVFNYARRLGFYAGDPPTRLVKKPRVNNARLRYLEHPEAEALLEALDETAPDVRDMALLSLHCGLRFGEIAALTWNRVDLPGGRLTLLDTKHGDRIVPITTAVKTMFERRPGDTGLVFYDRKGKQYGQAPHSFT